MRSRISIGKYIVYCILESLLVYVLTLSFIGYMNFRMNYWILAGIIVGSNIIFYILVSYPMSAVILGIFVPLASFIFYMIKKVLFLSYTHAAWKITVDTVKWFWKYCFNDDVNVEKLYSIIIIVCYIILCTIIVYLLATVWKKVILLMTAGVVGLSLMWYFGYDDAFKYLQMYLFLSFLIFGFVQYDMKEMVWRIKSEKYSRKTTVVWMISTVLSTLLIFFMVNILPPEFKPVSIEWLNENVFSRLQDIGISDNGSVSGANNRVFSIGAYGFQNKPSKLGGSIKMSDKLLLKVKIDGIIKPPYYLRGTVKYTYNGLYWTKSANNMKNIKPNTEIQQLLGNDSKVSEYLDTSVTIYPQAISTVSIFNLWRPSLVDINTDYRFDDTGDLTVPGNKMKAKEYKVASRIPIVYSDDLSKAKGLSDETIKDMQPYLSLSDSIPDRVKSLTNKIIGNSKSNFEKANAIQGYLRSNFPYDLNTSDVPDKRDFVDYFLFDEKKGYCTYYASAMAVMSRIAGIPSRYVEGFIIDDQDYAGDGIYNATAAKAHAWVELYFDGYGWVRFEPTAYYLQPDYVRPEEISIDTSTAPQTNQDDGLNNPQINKRDIEDRDDTQVSSGTAKKRVPVYIYAIAAVILILLLRILIKVFGEIKAIKNADSMEGKDAVIEYYHLLEKKLKSGGIERYNGETPGEFGRRVNDQLSAYELNMPELMGIFYRTRFGNEKIADGDRAKFKSVIKTIERYVRERKGIIKYLVIKFIL